jgi:alpha-mannosidase
VALLNRGLPGSLVTPQGEAHISLMRACSAWPCGIWLDGDKRTVPDGSSFAWQHWSHTFEYALATGPGDWRTAGFPRAGQEYNHPLLTGEVDLHPGPLPGTASLASVEPAAVGLMALKPRGNPLVPLSQPDPADGVTVRLRDLGGQAGPAVATVRLFTGVAAASVTGMLEQDTGPPADCHAGAVTATVPARGTVTLAVHPAGLAAGPGAPVPGGPAIRPEVTGSSPEPAQPVFTRYWLHGKGPAPAGNMGVAVHLSPGLLTLGPGAGGTLRLTVACGPQPASGTVTLDFPAGLQVQSASAAPLHYHLAANGFAAWDLAVLVRPDAPLATHFVAARIMDEAGQVLEDAVAVAVAPAPLAAAPTAVAPTGAAHQSLAELVAGLDAQSAAEAAEAELTAVTGDLELRPGGRGEVTVRLANHTASELRGEAQLISPKGSWAAVGPWSMGFRAESAAAATLTFTVAVPAGARPGEQWWALVKVMYFGRLRYSKPVWVSVVT